MMVEMKRFETGVGLVDDRWSPLLISYFFGEVTMEIAEWHGELHRKLVIESARRGRKIVTITDSSYTRPPAAEVRRYWAEMTRALPPEAKAATLGASVVIKSAVIRGIVTALSWLNEDLRSVETFESIDAAITAARRALAEAGEVLPGEPGPYRLPDGVERIAASWMY